ncbi:adenine phosphoribosyltransferase-like [Rhopilema esculentum]|uniref:adenine phosphoribosyltransferase-like n=1 Tax=Rhopilema esculentum TaxID=499914 RepID=UPI0031D50264
MASSGNGALENLKGLIKAVPDFPKAGILFRDIMPIFKNQAAVTDMVELMIVVIKESYSNVDVIAGLDARGFLVAPLVANKLGKPFVPVRKAGKLPGKTISKKSTKEYGEDVLEIQADAINQNDKIVIIDDLLATGGTLAAACDLFKEAGGNVIGSICLVELTDLNGTDKIKDINFTSLIKY